VNARPHASRTQSTFRRLFAIFAKSDNMEAKQIGCGWLWRMNPPDFLPVAAAGM